MIYVYILIFILSLASGGALSYYQNYTPMEWTIALSIAGFAGSSVIALVFSFFFFFRKETDTEKIQRLNDEITQLKQQPPLKRLE